jgi:hypothetical protein
MYWPKLVVAVWQGAAVRTGVASTAAGFHSSSPAAAAAARTWGGAESAAVVVEEGGQRPGSPVTGPRLAGRAGTEECRGQGRRAIGWRLRQRDEWTCGT